MTSPPREPVDVRLGVPSTARAGVPLPISLLVENRTDAPVTLYLRGRAIAFDIIVARDDGTVIWRRLDGEVVPAIVQVKQLEPREVLELRAEWDQRTKRGRRVAPGLYSVRGELLTDMPTPLATTPVHLRIAPD